MKWLLILLMASAVAATTFAQELKVPITTEPTPSITSEFSVGEGYEQMIQWEASPATMRPDRELPEVKLSEIAFDEFDAKPKGVVLTEKSLLIGRYIYISNGQAGNNGPYPDSYLDARTISLPLPR